MNKKHACLISCSDHYAHRLNVAAQCFQAAGYHVTYITSDFDHVTKKAYTCEVPGCVQLHAMPYRKNLSAARILSHRNFARDVFAYLEGLTHQPDALLVLLPPNYLAKYAAAYKKRHPEVKLIFDIFDLWPETFPSAGAKTLLAPVFRVWAGLRDQHLSAADHIITECELFRRRLGLHDENSTAVYLGAAEPDCGIIQASLSRDQWQLCYLGSVNNIIDIPKICELIRGLVTERPVVLHIIGSGERLQELMISAQAAGASVICHGAVYEDLAKQEIMSQCHFGLNILKDSVCIGLTMKSVDYFSHSLPIISNVPADTADLIKTKHCGLLLDANSAQRINAMDVDQCLLMRQHTRSAFLEVFNRDVIAQQYADVLNRIM